MIVRLASEQDANGFIVLAGQVEHWFGPMVDDPGFRAVIDKHIRQATALVAAAPGETGLLGGLLFSAKSPTYHVQWLVVSERARRQGVGRALMTEATRRFPPGPATVEVITFGTDHPGAAASGARAFYERLGFTAAEAAPPDPEGGLPPGLPQNHCLTEAPALSYSAAAYYPDLLVAPVS
jgi:ribosomal protein S18 acetylase RimI-like enzyme